MLQQIFGKCKCFPAQNQSILYTFRIIPLCLWFGWDMIEITDAFWVFFQQEAHHERLSVEDDAESGFQLAAV